MSFKSVTDHHHMRAHRAFRRGAVALALTMCPVTAAAYETRAIGAWVVAESSDRKGCFLSRTYPAPRETTLQFGLDMDGGNRLTLLNARWSIRPRDQFKMDFRFSNATFPRHVAIGIAAQGKKGFVSSFGRSFPATLAASRFLAIRRGDVPVEELDLDGSGAAITALRACVGAIRPASVTGRPARESGGHIPTDPFASGNGRESRK